MARKKNLTRNQKKAAGMSKPSGRSKYGRKRSYLDKHGGWGSDYLDKPWKQKMSNATVKP